MVAAAELAADDEDGEHHGHGEEEGRQAAQGAQRAVPSEVGLHAWLTQNPSPRLLRTCVGSPRGPR
ncbi:hypothetical protein GCM10007231_19660 [Nocardioides daphniae]|uniref:Uncharacterized protein n=1 Tax=Nocardioides daphniae TaxID=402297 RepID=A0ABQ1QB38_9ACTN|nr:hypothetical protein GCM10007231_19660 [Nocardioides daphniae]